MQDISPDDESSDVLRPTFHEGDVVQVRESKEIVSSLQYRHQIWSNEMQEVTDQCLRSLPEYSDFRQRVRIQPSSKIQMFIQLFSVYSAADGTAVTLISIIIPVSSPSFLYLSNYLKLEVFIGFFS